jgi:hypothetical protein
MIFHMSTTYETVVIGHGNNAAIEIPDKNLAELGGHRRAPLKVTVRGYTYQSTATGVDGTCMVVFPMRDRVGAGVSAGDRITVTLELDGGYREVELPRVLIEALAVNNLGAVFRHLPYSKRKEFARQVSEAKTDDMRVRRIHKVITALTAS